MAGQCGPSLLRSDPDQRLQEPPFDPTHTERTPAMNENPDAADNLTEEEASADEAARLADPFRHAILHRDRSATARALVDRLSDRFGTPPAADGVTGGAI